MPRKKQVRQSLNSSYTIILVLIILVFAAYALANIVGPSAYDDDPIYLTLANQFAAHSSLTYSNYDYIYTARLLQIIPIAILFKLFGVGVLTSGAWDLLCYLGIIAVTFYFTKEMHSPRAAIIASVLAGTFPLLFRSATTAIESVPMAFVTSLGILALIYGWRRKSPSWFFACGLILVLSFMITPESAIAIIFASAAVLYLSARQGVRIGSQYLIPGAVIGILIMLLLNYAYFTDPLYPFTLNNVYYNNPHVNNILSSATQGLMYYPYILFPYDNSVDINQVGPYFYFLIPAALYLAVRKVRKSYFALAWLGFSLAYLEFGPMHISLYPSLSYVMLYGVARFLLLAVVPMAAVMGMAFASAAEIEKGALHKAAVATSSVSIAIIVLASLTMNLYWHSVAYLSSYDSISISSYLLPLQNSTVVYIPSNLSNIPSYMRFDNLSRFHTLREIKNCSDILPGSYVVSANPGNVDPLSLYHMVSSCPQLSLISLPRAGNTTPYYSQIAPDIIPLNLYHFQNQST
ncbi:MAG: glycosyltransferase family 39 protein [Candidatus Micrarchaeota archaeon]|nr:glycosyltransferase family 39 protein [Candidatus Micrarchaeota archaeon]